jgi:dUTP pyrophosphatase
MNYIDDSRHGQQNLVKAFFGDGGFDICSNEDKTIYPNETVAIDTKIKVEIPLGYVGIIKSRSGLNFKFDVSVVDGVIDYGYQGYVAVKLINDSDHKYAIKSGDRIAQLVVMPIYMQSITKVEKFEESDRSNDGFGSSGK